MDDNNRPMLGHADLQALLSGLPPSIRGQAYLDFLDRLEAAGLRFERPAITLTKSAPESSSNKRNSQRKNV
jgi:hypothetical protein